MNAPLASIVIPTYDRAAFLPAAIQSARAQSLMDHEILVIDDGSEDATPAILRAIRDPRLRVIRHARNLGIPAARNTGLHAARGRYLAWLDSDDVARPRRLERQVRFLEEHPDLALVGSCAGVVDHAGRRKRSIKVPPFSPAQVKAWLLFRSGFQQSSVTGRTAVLRDYPYSLDYPVCEDLDVLLRITDRHAGANLPAILIDRRRHAEQTIRTHGAAIRQHKAELLAPGLRRLGLDVDAGDLACHLTLASAVAARSCSREYVAAAEAWLGRLLDANRRSAAVPEEALRMAVSFFWTRLCVTASRRQGVAWAGSHLLRSSLSAGLLTSEARSWLAGALRAVLTDRGGGRRQADAAFTRPDQPAEAAPLS